MCPESIQALLSSISIFPFRSERRNLLFRKRTVILPETISQKGRKDGASRVTHGEGAAVSPVIPVAGAYYLQM